MKILMSSGRVTPFFSARLRLLDSIKDKGWDVTVSGYEPDGKELCDKHGTGFYEIPFERAGMNPLKDFKIIKLYQKIMSDEKFDVVHSYTIKPNIYGTIAAKRAGIQKIYPTVNGLGYSFTEGGNSGFKSIIVRVVVSKLYKKAFSYATKVFFQNYDDADLMVRKGIISRDKCVIISGSGIELPAFPYSDVSVAPVTFLIATRLLITKGVRTYFEAAQIVKMNYPEAKFLIAGGLDPNPDGITEDELRKYTDSGIVKYLGHVDNMPKILSDCSVFVLPSFYREGVPHAILEAMSTGRAIITCNTPGCRETVRKADENGKGENGFLVEPKDSQMLAEKMIWLIEHPDDVKRMGAESRRYAEERFDVEKVNAVMMNTMGIK